MKRLMISAAACAAAVLCANAAQYWRGTTDNPVWDLTTANWAADATTTARKTFTNGTASTNPETTFDADGAADVTVDNGGVEAYVKCIQLVAVAPKPRQCGIVAYVKRCQLVAVAVKTI